MMLYEANIYQMNVEGHTFWVAESKALKGCVGQGETSTDAINELEINEVEWIETAREFDIPIPPQTAKVEKKYSGKFSLRMSPFIHQKSAESAESLGISLNQYTNDALAAYNERTHASYNIAYVQQSASSYHETSSNIMQFPNVKAKFNTIHLSTDTELEEM